MRTNARLVLLFGTSEVEARLRLLDRDVLEPGDAALAQLQCAAPVAVPARDRFVLRIPSPPATVAGGRVLEPETIRLRRHAPAVLARLSGLAGADLPGIVAGGVEAAGPAGIALDRLARLGGVAPARAAALLQDLPVVIGRGRMVVARTALDSVLAQVPVQLAKAERTHPEGISREQLAASLPGVGTSVLEEAVGRLVVAGVLRQAGGIVSIRRDAQEQDRARRDAALAAELAEALRHAGLSPPDAAELAPGAQARKLLERLVREGTVIRTVDRVQKREILFHRDAVDAARRQLAPLLVEGPGLLVGEAGSALGITRKYSVPLLEYFDSIRFTRRVDDRRVLARRA